jgi:hypothetical protein
VSYRVVWRRSARQRLDALAFIERERGEPSDRILRAIDEVELRLALDPLREGESRGGAERVLLVNPLTVRYEVFENDGVVLIYSARVRSPRRP